MADLSVTIGGDSSDLDRELSSVEKQLRTLERRREARIRIGADVGDLDRRITETNTRLGTLRTNLNSAGQAANNFNRNAANGSNTLTQFSRIAQDAPFGIMGIGNNLTATAEAFANLSRSSGGAGNALRAVASSLLGSGGILLAVSLVTTALTVMSQKGLTLSDVMEKLSGSISSSRKEMQKLEAEVAKNAQSQISSVGAYVSAAKNINLSMSDRLIAVRKLQDEYPAYFGNLTKEQILNGNVAGAVQEVTKALINKARATALTEKLIDLASKEEDIYSRLSNYIISLSKELGLNVKDTYQLATAINQLVKSGKDFNEVSSKDISALPERLKQFVLQNGMLKEISNEIKANQYQQEQYTKKINASTAASIKLEQVAAKTPKAKQEARAKIEAIPKLDPARSRDDENDRALKIMRDWLSEDLTKLKTVPIPLNIPLQANIDSRGITLESIRIQKLLNELNDNASEIINTGIADTFANLGEVIGSGLAKGSNILGMVGDSLLATLGGILVELGKMAISTGIGILAIKTSLQSLNPYVAIGAGVALIAIGSAVKGSAKGLGNSMGSSSSSSGSGVGSATSSGTTGASYSSPGNVASNTGGTTSSSSTVVFEISGSSLIGVLRNTLDSNKRLGGSLTI